MNQTEFLSALVAEHEDCQIELKDLRNYVFHWNVEPTKELRKRMLHLLNHYEQVARRYNIILDGIVAETYQFRLHLNIAVFDNRKSRYNDPLELLREILVLVRRYESEFHQERERILGLLRN